MKRLALWVAMAAVVSGCAAGKTIEYRGTNNFVRYQLRPALRLGVVDRRDVNADADDWVGTQQSVVGVPFPVKTASGRSLAQDLGEMLANSLGTDVVKQVLIKAGSDDRAARERVVSMDDGLGVLVTLKKWQTNVMARAELTYDVSLEVMDGTGKTLAFATQAGSDFLAADNPRRANLAVAVTSIFGALLNDAEVRRALESANVAPAAPAGAEGRRPLGTTTPRAETSEPAPPPVEKSRRPLGSTTEPAAAPAPAPQPVAQPPPPAPAPAPAATPTRSPAKSGTQGTKAEEKPKCSVDQILKMKELKFTDAQIKAACPD